MRQSTYLNVILTVNAVLLAGLIWTQIAGHPSLSTSAHAQTSPGVGIPNAADQRQRIINELQEVRNSMDATRRVLESGKMKVEVTNLDQIKLDKK